MKPHARTRRTLGASLAAICIAVLAGCATRDRAPGIAAMRPDEARAFIGHSLPSYAQDRSGWATDIYAALAALRIEATPQNICAVLAVTEQESGFRADPSVPGLSAIAWKQIDQRAEQAGVPILLVHGALRLSSPNGKSYSERIDNARTEKDLSDIFEDFVGMVPMGKRLFAGWNPVRTGGPMQVSIEFSEKHAAAKTYPYPMEDNIRHEVFTRRGGMYFGIAHLLDYPAAYDKPLYRFADFNAGHYASRNAALQSAISIASGIPLALDGDLVRHDGNAGSNPGSTELAARVLADRLDMSHAAIRRDLEQGDGENLERTGLYQHAFQLAEKVDGRALPRAVVPRITLQSPKITRKLTTEWFANRVDDRYRRCLAAGG